MTDNDEFDMDTREGRLANNKGIMEQEHATEDEIFYNQIETRLGLPEELQEEADVRLGNAYVNSLAQHEARGDYTTWAPLSVRHLMSHESISMDEASVIVAMTALEYGNLAPALSADALAAFVRYIRPDDPTEEWPTDDEDILRIATTYLKK